MVFVFDPDLQVAAFAGQILRVHFLSVQVIREVHGYGKVLSCFALIIDILPFGIPCDRISAFGISLIALYVFYVFQIRPVL